MTLTVQSRKWSIGFRARQLLTREVAWSWRKLS